jgi:hypothetical protein
MLEDAQIPAEIRAELKISTAIYLAQSLSSHPTVAGKSPLTTEPDAF